MKKHYIVLLLLLGVGSCWASSAGAGAGAAAVDAGESSSEAGLAPKDGEVPVYDAMLNEILNGSCCATAGVLLTALDPCRQQLTKDQVEKLFIRVGTCVSKDRHLHAACILAGLASIKSISIEQVEGIINYVQGFLDGGLGYCVIKIIKGLARRTLSEDLMERVFSFLQRYTKLHHGWKDLAQALCIFARNQAFTDEQLADLCANIKTLGHDVEQNAAVSKIFYRLVRNPRLTTTQREEIFSYINKDVSEYQVPMRAGWARGCEQGHIKHIFSDLKRHPLADLNIILSGLAQNNRLTDQQVKVIFDPIFASRDGLTEDGKVELLSSLARNPRLTSEQLAAIFFCVQKYINDKSKGWELYTSKILAGLSQNSRLTPDQVQQIFSWIQELAVASLREEKVVEMLCGLAPRQLTDKQAEKVLSYAQGFFDAKKYNSAARIFQKRPSLFTPEIQGRFLALEDLTGNRWAESFASRGNYENDRSNLLLLKQKRSSLPGFRPDIFKVIEGFLFTTSEAVLPVEHIEVPISHIPVLPVSSSSSHPTQLTLDEW